MHRFKGFIAERYPPIVHIQTSREVDALVHTVYPSHSNLPSLLTPLSKSLLTHNSTPPPLWRDIISSLQTSISNPVSTSALLSSYTDALESATARVSHDHLRAPALLVLAVWVCEPDIRGSLAQLYGRAEKNVLPGTAAYGRGVNARIRVLMVCRQGSRQDEARVGYAKEEAEAEYGEGFVWVMRLGEELDNMVLELDAVVTDEMERVLEVEGKEAEKIRKATRTFRNWLVGTGSGARRVEMMKDEEGIGGAAKRRVSLGGVMTPMFPPESLEARMRQLADMSMMLRRYEEAADTYRSLAQDLKGMVGPAIVHEASAWEMAALASAMIDGSKQGVGRALERAIESYCRAGRRELAVRAALRAVEFCHEAGYPDSAAGVIVRAIEKVISAEGRTGGTGGAFVMGALGILYASCSEAYLKMGKRRRASLHAFLSARRFVGLKAQNAAAIVLGSMDEQVMGRRSVRDEVDLMMGLAQNGKGQYVAAVRTFGRILGGIEGEADPEVQGDAIRGLLNASDKGAGDGMRKRWDSGVLFPIIDMEEVRVRTVDDGDETDDWTELEDEILEDMEFFNAAKKTLSLPLPARELPLERRITQIRKKGRDGRSGVVEAKISMMRETAKVTRKRRREDSMLNRRAVIGEQVCADIVLHNPLLFPVFLSNINAVVELDGDLKDDSCEGVTLMTRNDIILLPRSKQRVVIGVVPHKQCDMKFVGVRWEWRVGMGGKDGVEGERTLPGYCVLFRRGRRLNETRKQRAAIGGEYEVDMSLSVRVGEKLGRLGIKLMDDKLDQEIGEADLAIGETRQIRLKLENLGTEKVEGIVLRFGTPDCIYFEAEGEEHLGRMMKIGGKGLVKRTGDMFESVYLNMGLEVGEKKYLDGVLRGIEGGGKGKWSVRVIVGYGKGRICRAGATGGLKQSLRAGVRFVRKGKGGTLIGVEVEHGGGEGRVMVTHLGLVGRGIEAWGIMKGNEEWMGRNETSTLFCNVKKSGCEEWKESKVDIGGGGGEVVGQLTGWSGGGDVMIGVGWKDDKGRIGEVKAGAARLGKAIMEVEEAHGGVNVKIDHERVVRGSGGLVAVAVDVTVGGGEGVWVGVGGGGGVVWGGRTETGMRGRVSRRRIRMWAIMGEAGKFELASRIRIRGGGKVEMEGGDEGCQVLSVEDAGIDQLVEKVKPETQRTIQVEMQKPAEDLMWEGETEEMDTLTA